MAATGVSTALSSATYIKNSIPKFEHLLRELKTSRVSMDENYYTEASETNFLSSQQATLFRGIVGSANWMVPLG